VHWRFSDAGRRSAWIASSCRRPKTCTDSDIGGSPIRRGSRSGVGEIIAARRKKQNGLGGAN
jgi:hypothetical protein